MSCPFHAGTAAAILREHRQLSERIRACAHCAETKHVFATESGVLQSPGTPTQLMPRLVTAAGVP